jgi:hypothetical protein
MPDSTPVKRRKRVKAHWYRMHVGECPVCGSDKSYRERVHGKRPRRMASRYVYLSETTTYDHCLGN